MSASAVTKFERTPSSLPAELTRIESALALANTPAEVNQVIALMDAAVAYAKRFYKDQQDVIQRAKTLRLQAERRLGEMLRAMPKATGAAGTGRPNLGGSKTEPPKTETTLSDIGIDKKTSMRAQKLARLTPEKFEAVASGAIPVSEILKTPKTKTAARRQAEIHEHRVVLVRDGSTPLIVVMRSAYHEISAASGEIKDLDKALVMAKKLAAALSEFIAKFDGHATGQKQVETRAELSL